MLEEFPPPYSFPKNIPGSSSFFKTSHLGGIYTKNHIQRGEKMSETQTKAPFDFLETADKIRAKRGMRDTKLQLAVLRSKLGLQKDMLDEIESLSEQMDIALRNGNTAECIFANDRLFRLVSRSRQLNEKVDSDTHNIYFKED